MTRDRPRTGRGTTGREACSLRPVDALKTDGLTKLYGHARRGPLSRGGEVPALTDLSIRVNVGEIFGFLGPNGAGKSTTIRLLLGFLHPTRRAGRRCSGSTAGANGRRSAAGSATCPAASRCTTR